MIALDTNVLLRLIINDNSEHSFLARKLVENEHEIYIASVVQVELVWVLKRTAKLTKSEIIFSLNSLAANNSIVLQNRDLFMNALNLYTNLNADFSDYLITLESQSKNAKLWTFDKKLSKHNNAKLLA